MTKYECEGQLSIFDYMSPAQEYYFDTGKTTYWQDSQGKPYQWWKNEAPMCSFSGHTCNKQNLWEVAHTLDDIHCPETCCRQCNIRLCGARCNGSEEPKQNKAGDYVETHGERVLFEDIKVNHYYISDCSTQCHKWFKVIYVKWKKDDAVGYVDAPKGVNGKWSWGNNHSALSRKMYINADRNTASGEADTSGWMYRLPIEGVKQCE